MEEIFVDFNNSDRHGRIRLNTVGTLISINEKSINLIEGKQIELNDEDSLKNIGRLKFSKEENIWTAEIDWESFTHY